MEELFFELKQKVYEKLDINLDVSDEDLYKVIDVCIYEISQHRAISVHNRELLRQQLYNSIKRLDILQELLEDDDITEIMINGYKDIFIEKNNGSQEILNYIEDTRDGKPVATIYNMLKISENLKVFLRKKLY